MRICLIPFQSMSVNYGMRAIAYASEVYLRKILDESDYVESVTLPKSGYVMRRKMAIGLYRIVRQPMELFRELKRRINKSANKYDYSLRFKRFADFMKPLNIKAYSSVATLPAFDYYILESDQGWNPYGGIMPNPNHWLSFAKKERRISWCTSFGVSKIPARLRMKYAYRLNGFSYISVRETAGAKIVKELTGREATVLCDPVLLLTPQEWIAASSSAPKTDKPFLLTYFLGNTAPQEYHDQTVAIAAKRGLEIVNLNDENDNLAYNTGPGEFIDYIRKADIVCTNSYHGTIFSIIFKKPFVLFPSCSGNPSTQARFDTLLANFEIKDREVSKIINNPFDIDYSNADAVIERERENTKAFFLNALELNRPNCP